MNKLWNQIKEKIIAFTYVYKNSLYNAKYYSEILKTKLKFTLRYYTALAVVTAMISTLAFSIQAVPQALKTVNNFAEKAKEIYPEDLIFNIINEGWEINKQQPYEIAIPTDLSEEEIIQFNDMFGELPKNIVIFDKEGTINQMRERESMALVNKSNILVNMADGARVIPIESIIPMKRFEGFQFTKTEFINLANNLKNAPYFYPILVFVLDIVSLAIAGSVQILLVGVLAYMLSLIIGAKLKFIEVTRVSIHAATPIFTLQLIMGLLEIFIDFPPLFLLLHLGFTAIIVLLMRKSVNTEVEVKS